MDISRLPKTITGPAAWVGSMLAKDEGSWLYRLSSADISELENAARHFLSLGRNVGEITATDFPLFSFTGHLERLQKKLLHGNGIEVLRGLPVANYSQEFAATVFCGIGAHLGSARSQNAAGHILGHVRDLGASSKDPTTRIYQTAERQTFHTDSADVVGLLCLREAKEGGRSLLVSAETLYNRMRELRPDLLEKLFDPIATDRRGEVPEGGKPWMTIPPLSWFEGPTDRVLSTSVH